MGEKNVKQDLVLMPMSKRLFDIIFSLIVLVLTSPMIFSLLTAIFVEHVLRCKMFVSLFYVEKRISQGQEFNLIKFNIFKPRVIESMRKQGIFIHTKPLEHDGHSLTIVGKVLQRTYLDELPQFFNILKGDLSLVGPRPVNLEVYENMLKEGVYSKTVIKSGLTGNFQALKGMTDKTDIELDNQYIDYCRSHSSLEILFFDMKIIGRTLKVLFKAQGI